MSRLSNFGSCTKLNGFRLWRVNQLIIFIEPRTYCHRTVYELWTCSRFINSTNTMCGVSMMWATGSVCDVNIISPSTEPWATQYENHIASATDAPILRYWWRLSRYDVNHAYAVTMIYISFGRRFFWTSYLGGLDRQCLKQLLNQVLSLILYMASISKPVDNTCFDLKASDIEVKASILG